MNKDTLHKIPWGSSIWFSDVDDTLINTAEVTPIASNGIKRVFESRFDKEIAEKIQQSFNQIFQSMLHGLRNKTEEDWKGKEEEKKAFEALWNEIRQYQQEIEEKYGTIKKFSREVFIKIAADRNGITVSPEIIYEAADAYWITLSEVCQPLPGALELTQEIKKHGRPLYLVTSSDARLKIKANGQFEYNPEYSENFKRERMQLLREKGIEFNTVSIGDPEDKPHKDFFQKGIKSAEQDLGFSIDLSNAIIMGDSYVADLQTPKEMGFGLVVLVQQESNKTEVIDKHQIVTNTLAEVSQYLVD